MHKKWEVITFRIFGMEGVYAADGDPMPTYGFVESLCTRATRTGNSAPRFRLWSNLHPEKQKTFRLSPSIGTCTHLLMHTRRFWTLFTRISKTECVYERTLFMNYAPPAPPPIPPSQATFAVGVFSFLQAAILTFVQNIVKVDVHCRVAPYMSFGSLFLIAWTRMPDEPRNKVREGGRERRARRPGWVWIKYKSFQPRIRTTGPPSATLGV